MTKITNGWLNGFMGVLIFSISLPATRAAVQGFDPFFLTCVRATIAALLAIMLLLVFKQKRPIPADIYSLIIIAIGVVVGFPLLTAIALQHISASHSIIFIGLLPLVTAIFGALRTKTYPPTAFWVFSCIGAAMVIYYAVQQDFSTSIIGNISMAAAIIICGIGYAEGAILTKRLAGWQVISWALLIALPFTLVASLYTMPTSFSGISQSAWLGLAYVSVFSMLIGFIFWYKGLAQGGIAAVSQLQLLQPFFGLCWAALLLGETIEWQMIATTILVTACVLGTKYFSR